MGDFVHLLLIWWSIICGDVVDVGDAHEFWDVMICFVYLHAWDEIAEGVFLLFDALAYAFGPIQRLKFIAYLLWFCRDDAVQSSDDVHYATPQSVERQAVNATRS